MEEQALQQEIAHSMKQCLCHLLCKELLGAQEEGLAVLEQHAVDADLDVLAHGHEFFLIFASLYVPVLDLALRHETYSSLNLAAGNTDNSMEELVELLDMDEAQTSIAPDRNGGRNIFAKVPHTRHISASDP